MCHQLQEHGLLPTCCHLKGAWVLHPTTGCLLVVACYYYHFAGEGFRFRSEAVAVEVDLKERLSKLDLELPPSASLHRQQ